jgi:hypothetical protein
MKLMRMLAVTALLASSHLVYGQDETPVMTANVPFAFTAAGVSMPAGQYVISRTEVGQLWKLQTFAHPDVYLTVTPREVSQAPASSLLVFDRNATGYALRQFHQIAQTDVAQVVEPNRAKARKSTAQEVSTVRVLGR